MSSAALRTLQQQHSHSEIHWYVSSIIIPELPHVAEALQICSNLLKYNAPSVPDRSQHQERGPPIKLPVSSTKSEAIKGIMTRDGDYITQLTVQLKEPHFNKVLNKLVLRKPMVLKQVLTARLAIEEAYSVISDSSAFLCSPCSPHDAAHNHAQLSDTFRTLLSHLEVARNSLQIPSDPSLIFPLNVAAASSFEPELTPNIAVDLYVTRAEVCIDLKHLHIVKEKPWSEIDPESGKSYVDNVRDEMRLPASTQSTVSTASTPVVPSQPLNMADIESRLHDINHSRSADNPLNSAGRPSTPTILGNVLSHLSLKHRYDPIDYVTKCVTYNNSVVMINKKIEVSSPDPVLVSVFTKLDSIAYLVGTFLENIDTIMAINEKN
ncbi:Regulator of V-ATPase in vacuolar membrane protein 2 [Meyerozyma sp. JA9]|nr:Regulator of V-ATPase in vacuolar membrane protein 2 [Meyerozyma sp. JA9]